MLTNKTAIIKLHGQMYLLSSSIAPLLAACARMANAVTYTGTKMDYNCGIRHKDIWVSLGSNQTWLGLVKLLNARVKKWLFLNFKWRMSHDWLQ